MFMKTTTHTTFQICIYTYWVHCLECMCGVGVKCTVIERAYGNDDMVWKYGRERRELSAELPEMEVTRGIFMCAQLRGWEGRVVCARHLSSCRRLSAAVRATAAPHRRRCKTHDFVTVSLCQKEAQHVLFCQRAATADFGGEGGMTRTHAATLELILMTINATGRSGLAAASRSKSSWAHLSSDCVSD